MIEKGLGWCIDALAGLPIDLRYMQDILPVDGGRGNSQTCRLLVQK
jgi:hypothetical protein